MKHRVRGFTLIELMVVITVLAIIASIAVPSYRNYVLRAQRSDATAELLRIRTAQEKFFLQNSTYTGDFGPAGLRMTPAASTTFTSEHGHFAIDFQGAVTPTTFRARAIAAGGQTADTQCRTFTVNELGVRTAANAGGTDTTVTCWR